MKLRMNLPPLVPRGARRVSLSRLAQPRAGPDAGTDRGAFRCGCVDGCVRRLSDLTGQADDVSFRPRQSLLG